MPTLSGEVQRVTFENEETGFRVLKMMHRHPLPSSPPESVVVVGVFAPVAAGSQVRVTGNYVEDRKHGRQFRADSLVVLAPETLDGIERYLGSGVIPGLGPGFAKRIVETFGTKTLQVLDGDQPPPTDFEVGQVAAAHLVVEQVAGQALELLTANRHDQFAAGLVDRLDIVAGGLHPHVVEAHFGDRHGGGARRQPENE